MRPRRWTDIVGPPLLAAAAAVVLVVPAVAESGRWRAAHPSIRVASPPATLPACVGRARSASVERAAPGPAAWYRLDPVLDATGGLKGQRLVAGRLGQGGDVVLPLAVESHAFGPSGGRVLVGNDDGRRSSVQILDVVGRCSVVVHEGRDLIRRAVFDPSVNGIMEFRLDRWSRADLGVWSRLSDGSKPRQLMEPLAPSERVGRIFATDLSWSLDGSRLVVTSCGESSCIARILDRSTGGLTTVDDPRVGDVLGLVGDDLLAYGGCPTLPCEIVAMNLRTERIRVLAKLAGLATVAVAKGGGAIVAFEDYRTHELVRVVDLDGTTLRTLPLGDGLRLVPSSNRALAGIELPAGVIALAEGGRLSDRGKPPTFIDLADGRKVSAEEIVR